MPPASDPTPSSRALPRAIAGWALWTFPPPVVCFVVVVSVVGFGAAAVTAVLLPIHIVDLTRFAILAGCALVHLEATRHIERMRRTAGPEGKAPHLDLRTVWNFAALLLLPPALATAMVLFTSTHIWLRVRPGGQRRKPHRVVYSTATVLIANQAATAVLLLAPGTFPDIPTGLTGLALIVAAATLRWLINYALIVAVIMLTNPQSRGVQSLGPLGVQALEVGAVALALAVALFLVQQPLLLPVLVAGLVVFHRCVLLDEFQAAARSDHKTGLLNSIAWTQLAGNELARAERNATTLGILMIDVDHFAKVNSSNGHPGGDLVLQAVAKALRAEVRDYDHVGRYGGDEFVIALPGISRSVLRSVAERLHHRVHHLAEDPLPGNTPVTRITVSIGGAMYPLDGTTLDELVRCADANCYTAKARGRDQVWLSPG